MASATRKERMAAAMIKDIIGVCRRYGMSLGHQDTEGAFIVYTDGVDPRREAWLEQADVRHTPNANPR